MTTPKTEKSRLCMALPLGLQESASDARNDGLCHGSGPLGLVGGRHGGTQSRLVRLELATSGKYGLVLPPVGHLARLKPLGNSGLSASERLGDGGLRLVVVEEVLWGHTFIIGIPNSFCNRYSERNVGEYPVMNLPPTFATFGARLEWWIENRKMTQAALAKATGIPQSSISELIKGKLKAPSASNLFKLADALRVRPRYLLLGDGAAEANSFADLNGLEAQLVMLFRSLPDDAKRDALLIDANNFVNRMLPAGRPSGRKPFPRQSINSAQGARVYRFPNGDRVN